MKIHEFHKILKKKFYFNKHPILIEFFYDNECADEIMKKVIKNMILQWCTVHNEKAQHIVKQGDTLWKQIEQEYELSESLEG